MITALIFIIVLGVLVFVHEFGHFIFAKRAGMKVEEFGFGFPPRFFGIKKGETLYSINWIPFGGFVKILGEDGESDNPRSFTVGSLKAKLTVIVAGVVMNFLLAALLLMLGNFLGLRIGLVDDKISPGVTDPRIQIVQISNNSPAQAAGLQLLDEIRGFRVGSSVKNVATAQEVQDFIHENTSQALKIIIKRGNEVVEKAVSPRTNPPAGEGAVGISLALTGVVKYPWYESIWRGVYDAVLLTINTTVGYFTLFKTLLVKGKLMADISGPIGIATLTGQAARVGINYLMQFVAMISINLAVLNIIPFPALDGGRALMIIIEKIKGSPVNKKTEQLVNAVGFAVLISLMIYVTIKDVSRFF